ncbi:MAG: tryptophan synthase subunit alpha [Nocardioidaceae bacterium]
MTAVAAAGSPVRSAIEACRAEGRAALVGYLPAGFPDLDTSVAALKALVDAGADVVEVGLPYTDPVLDGPTIQEAAQVALSAGTRTRDVLDVVDQVAGLGVPTVVMTYWNPVERYGVDRFAAALVGAGGAGLITPDLVPDEAAEWLAAADSYGLDRVFLVAPSSTSARLLSTAAACRGFVYATSVMGVTGARAVTSAAAPTLVRRVRAATDLPVGVGLGVSNAEQAADVAGYADAVIVGSAFVRRLLDADTSRQGLASVAALAAELAEGVRR